MPEVEERSMTGRELKYWQALNEALRLEMRRDSRIIVLGEDIAGAAGRENEGLIDAWGGPYGVTRGLIEEFGKDRVRDTPISEAAFIGAAIGLALDGYRPWVDLMFSHFAGVAWDQLVNKMARTQYLTAGQATLPITVKTFGYGYGAFAHFPGLVCIAPSDAYTAKGLMISAIRENNPVICFDDERLVRQRMVVPEESYTIPLGRARVVREGRDVTLVGISSSTDVCRRAASVLSERGIEAEVVDLLSVMPWDEDGIAASVEHTRRLVIVDFDHPQCGIASEIAAVMAERMWKHLECAPVRVLPPAIPLSLDDGNEDLIKMYLPSVERTVEAVDRCVRQ